MVVTPQRNSPASGSSLPGQDLEQRRLRQRRSPDEGDLVALFQHQSEAPFEHLHAVDRLGQVFDREQLLARFALGLEADERILARGRSMSSSVSFSSCFLREVACRDFEALALKRAMKALSSSALSSIFLFLSCAACSAAGSTRTRSRSCRCRAGSCRSRCRRCACRPGSGSGGRGRRR